jgi:hypothetical protein
MALRAVLAAPTREAGQQERDDPRDHFTGVVPSSSPVTADVRRFGVVVMHACGMSETAADRPTAMRAPARTVVTRVASHDDGDGHPHWEITVTRGVPFARSTSASDVPQDIRDTLRAWLDAAEEAGA